jgi:DNA mismatch endonuclease (patch repair protein)
MTDPLSKADRSRVMAGIKDRDTGPELAVRRELRRLGLGYRKNVKDMPGKPDVVLSKYGAVIFVNGCFWHQHPGCSRGAGRSRPKSNVEFWNRKLDGNVARDVRNRADLAAMGWLVFTVWECEIRKGAATAVAEIAAKLEERKESLAVSFSRDKIFNTALLASRGSITAL